MSESWTVVINNGEYTFEVPTRFSIRKRKQVRQDGSIDFFETIVALEGILRGQGATPADDVTTRFQKLLAIADRATVLVELKLNGTTRYRFTPSGSLGGPTIREIAEIPSGSSHATHVRFSCNLYVRTVTAATDVEIDFEATYYNNLLQQAVWKVTSQAATLTAAKAKVMSFKPSANLKPLTAIYRQGIRSNEFSATWIYDREKGGGLLSVVERISTVPSGSSVRPDARVGKDARVVFFRGRHMPMEVEIEITMESVDPSLLVQPGPHLKEGAFIKRNVRMERPQRPAIFDSRKGLYRAVWNEFWYVDGGELPALNHTESHDKPFPDKTVSPPRGGVGVSA